MSWKELIMMYKKAREQFDNYLELFKDKYIITTSDYATYEYHSPTSGGAYEIIYAWWTE